VEDPLASEIRLPSRYGASAGLNRATAEEQMQRLIDAFSANLFLPRGLAPRRCSSLWWAHAPKNRLAAADKWVGAKRLHVASVCTSRGKMARLT
jgi:hypothetical protein